MVVKAISPIMDSNHVALHGAVGTLQNKINNLTILLENKNKELEELRKMLVKQHLNSKIIFCCNCSKEIKL